MRIDEKASPMMKTLAHKLNYWMARRGFTQKELSDKIGVTQQALRSWLQGIAQPRLDRIEALCAALAISPADLLTDREEEDGASQMTIIPILGRIIGGDPTSPLSTKIGEVEIPVDWARSGQYFALKVIGNSMAPEMREGDTVIVRCQSTVDSGDVAIVFVGTNESTMKKVVRSKEGITLYAYNGAIYAPHFYSNEDIESIPINVIGKVVQVRHMV